MLIGLSKRIQCIVMPRHDGSRIVKAFEMQVFIAVPCDLDDWRTTC